MDHALAYRAAPEAKPPNSTLKIAHNGGGKLIRNQIRINQQIELKSGKHESRHTRTCRDSQKCKAVPRRARIQGSYTFASLNSRPENNTEEEEIRMETDFSPLPPLKLSGACTLNLSKLKPIP